MGYRDGMRSKVVEVIVFSKQESLRRNWIELAVSKIKMWSKII